MYSIQTTLLMRAATVLAAVVFATPAGSAEKKRAGSQSCNPCSAYLASQPVPIKKFKFRDVRPVKKFNLNRRQQADSAPLDPQHKANQLYQQLLGTLKSNSETRNPGGRNMP